MFSLVLSGIRHYRSINVVVMLAVAISTAVIGGSLIIGDSVRYSLRTMTQQRLGKITDMLHSHRFFREDLASEFAQKAKSAEAKKTVVPAILVTGSLEARKSDNDIRRVGTVTLLGTGPSGWELLDHADIKPPGSNEVVLGYRTAKDLHVEAGDSVTVWVEVPSSIPRDSLLGEREEVNVEISATVAAVIPEDVGASRFDLNPGQQLPYNAFLPMTTLQERLKIEKIEASRRSPVAEPARINAILVSGGDGLPTDQTAVRELNKHLQQTITLEDVGLRLRAINTHGYISAETDRMILEDSVATAVTGAAEVLGLNASPTIVYLSNEIYAADRKSKGERYSMYSILAGTDLNASTPLGPFKLKDGDERFQLSDEEILLSAWLAEDLKVVVGDTVVGKWHEVGSHGELPEIEKQFTVSGILADDDPVSVDQNLTPHVKGVTDVESFSDVDQPFEMDMDRLTARDDDYWYERRATPKAFVSLSNAETLWKSRYGRYTSIRIAASAGADKPTEDQLNSISNRLTFEISRRLKPAELGMVFRPVLLEGLQAAVGANDFTMLFIGFSFFLIFSAIILASLMFRLGIQRRISQFGLLNAVGWPASGIERLFVLEAIIICIAGSVLGALGGIGFAKLMIYGLTTWWSGAVGTQYLLLDIQVSKLFFAAAVSICLAVLVIWLALRSFRQIEVREQLAGNAESSETGGTQTATLGRWEKLVRLVGIGSFVVAPTLPALVIAGAIPSGEAFGGLSWQIVCFFLAGFASLTAGLYLLRTALRRRSQQLTIRGTTGGLSGLAIANAARSPMRSMLTTALIAFATFVIVAVAAGRRNPLSEIPDMASGNGGFSLVAESAQPVLFDLNSAKGKSRLGLTAANALPDGVTVYPFSVKPGSDASCVNLYQTRVPTMLGAAEAFIERGGFRFAGTPDEEWKLLLQKLPDEGVPVIPVIGDMNTLKYSLKKGMGERIAVPNETNPEFLLQIVGMLDGSVFQGVVIMTDENLKRIDHEVAGARYFLAETPDLSDMERTAIVLETTLNDYGMDAEPVSERLAGFLAVQNTYLSTFQILGGLGLLVGSFGLAAAMVRNVVERRREIALMRAVGFTTLRVARLVLLENWVLLFWGILLGAAAALLAMLPHLQSTGADLPWHSLGITLGIVVLSGSIASVFAVRAATSLSIRANLGTD